jgi:hypothetical protein
MVATLLFLALHVRKNGVEHLLLIQVVLLHQCPKRRVMVLNQLQGLVMHVLLEHCVLAAVVNIIRMMTDTYHDGCS